MMIFKRIKDNLFLFTIILAYGLISIINPSMGLASVKNSGYYIKEMLMIMPVIFVLTALLDLWVPKEKIMQFLGKDAKVKGLFLAFVIGSISAGPIYAAFPMCTMLHKKGASIRNIVVILSSWAVIKIPMLLNEAKFLGLRFMIIRWLLTVAAIIIFSWLADKLIKDGDLPQREAQKLGVSINREACIGCRICVENYPELFEMKAKKAFVKNYDDWEIDRERLKKTMMDCPVKAIEYTE
ncbi:MAG: permease [Synergistaceae bacterium]|nr:permease [Synergistaceae bacterium]